MASEAATILKHGWIYTVANIVNRAAGLLLLPLYAKVLTPSEFGIYALIGVVGDILAVMLMIGMNNAFTVVYFEHAEEKDRDRVVSTTMFGLGTATLVLLALSYPAGWAVSLGLFGDGGFAAVIAVALASIALSTMFELALAYYRVHKRSGMCLLVSIAKAVLLLGLNLLFLLVLDLGVSGIFLANGVAFSILGLSLTASILARTGVGFSPAVLRRVVTLGLPFMPQSLLDIANQFVARWLLNVLMTTAAVGVFSFGMRLSTILYMFLTASFLQIWSVRRFEAQHGGEDREQSEFVFHLFIVVLTAAALGMTLTTPEILFLIASADYAPVLACMPFLTLSYVLHGVRMHSEVSLMKAKQMRVLPWVSAASLAAGSALAVALVWQWGVLGAAVAVLGRELFQITVTEWACRRLCPGEAPLNPARLLGILAPAVVAHAVGWEAFGAEVAPAFTAGKVALTAAAMAAAVFGPGLGPEGRALLFKLIGGVVRRRRVQPAVE
ncbi:lipopolysaccharide biosynthesis protein [Azospirillum sp. TSO22-1]|uniref:lipopolysaccharide biosynthesis protein n=1 Tax=Azospirillum sp. TSO22-1 TaxID=716789 RepID=UPI000D60A59C|nr:lipopolysaccharide biosynthesis protein [Azospirillum sp. TSO22-1]PWC34829.1 hypothetical protein TSO221_31025 [Azospirillum sp. TSO22-1]